MSELLSRYTFYFQNNSKSYFTVIFFYSSHKEWGRVKKGNKLPQRLTVSMAYKLIAAGCHTYKSFYGKHLACI